MEEFLTAMDVLPEADHKYVFEMDPVTYNMTLFLFMLFTLDVPLSD